MVSWIFAGDVHAMFFQLGGVRYTFFYEMTFVHVRWLDFTAKIVQHGRIHYFNDVSF